MAGHSAWANIKHRKSRQDAKRGKVWTKIAKAIIVAAQMGGGDPDSNLRLRYAILDARAASMPKDTIERAIKRGTGELDGGRLEETLYEGYGPAGVAVICEIMTDNPNRTAPEIRKIFEHHDGQLGKTNCVAYLFERKGLFLVPSDKIGEEALMDLALSAGADDLKTLGDKFEVTCPADSFGAVGEALDKAAVPVESKQVTRLPSTTVEIADVEIARVVMKLMDALDDHEDVQNVSSNFSISEEILASLA